MTCVEAAEHVSEKQRKKGRAGDGEKITVNIKIEERNGSEGSEVP